MATDVLYVSFDGVLQPLPFSQVVRVLAGLSRRGLRYHLLSIERATDLDNEALRKTVGDTLLEARVAWTPVRRDGSMGTPRRAAEIAARMTAEAHSIARRDGVKLIHARGYQSAAIACALKRVLGVKFLFDPRGYWIEERSGAGGWFSAPSSYAAGKFVEQKLFRAADAVVTLTELQAMDVASGLFGPPPKLLHVIPTCADYDAFCLRGDRPQKRPGAGRVPVFVQQRLVGKIVMGVVGAWNATYFARETVELAKIAAEWSPAIHLLVLSPQLREYGAALESAGLPPDRYTLASADHWDMPEWLQWIDWGLLLVPETAANRAKMPTKLGEFFAAGVRPVFFGCNSDAARWVEHAGSGHVLRSIHDMDLRGAARAIADSVCDGERLRVAREVTAPHFSLASGLSSYHRVVDACLGDRAGARSDSNLKPTSRFRMLGANGVERIQ